MTNRAGCMLVITSELTVANPVGGFRTSYCGGPRFKYRSEISYLHVNSRCRPRPIPSTSLPAAHRCKQWLRRSSCSLHLAPHARIRPTVKTPARTCSTTLPSWMVCTRQQHQGWVLLAPRSGR